MQDNQSESSQHSPPDPPEQKPENRKQRTIPPVPVPENWPDQVSALAEVKDPLAISLWRALRSVRLWANTAPEDRAGLFNEPNLGSLEVFAYASTHAPQLLEAFGTFAFLRRAPEQISRAQVAEACRHVYGWAEGHSLMDTAVHFAEAAAAVDPEDPSLANAAAYICRRASYNARASTWYKRGYRLASRMRKADPRRSRKEKIRSLLGYGALMRALGHHKKAKAAFLNAARAAKNRGMRRQAAEAQHELLTYAAEVGSILEGQWYASAALELYPLNSPDLPALAHDWAYLLVRYQYYSHALRPLDAALSLISRPGIQALVWSTLAWAAAGARKEHRFREAEQKALSLSAVYDEFAGTVLDHLAEGARIIGEWDKAERYAAEALEIARSRFDGGVEQDALRLLDAIAIREPPPPAVELEYSERVARFNRRLLAKLAKWKAPGRPPPGATSDGEAEASLD